MKTELLVSNITNASVCVHNIENAEDNSVVDWHIHDEYEIYMCFKGGKTFFLSDAVYPLSEGDIILVTGNAPHKTETKRGCSGFLIQLKPEYDMLLHVPKSENGAYVFGVGDDINRQLSACLSNIIDEHSKKADFFEEFIRAEVYKIFAVLYRNEIIKTMSYYSDVKRVQRIMPVLDYINNNYGTGISLGEMSGLLNVDKAHFCRIFKNATGTSLVDYINYVRITNAERILSSGKTSVGEIAELVGFSSEAYFCKLFKRYKACTPTQYRKYKGI
ncbi:MAG: helix-turn-helix transcriptional regulator [Oscillospiraceae bacterium]|nr:helix-turn-helix transcriptional regulator [Oscillospiraceae bacterium]